MILVIEVGENVGAHSFRTFVFYAFLLVLGILGKKTLYGRISAFEPFTTLCYFETICATRRSYDSTTALLMPHYNT